MPAQSLIDANLIITQQYAAMRPLLKAEAQQHLDAVVSSPVPPEKVSHFLELAYANGAALPKAVRDAAAEVGDIAWQNGFYGLGVDQRGQKMCAALRKTTFSRAATDPVPSPQFLPPASATTV